MKIIPVKIVIIHWVDSTYYRIETETIEELPELPQPRRLLSVGILICEDNHSITISQDTDPIGTMNRLVLTIPKVSIISKEIFTKKIKIID